jgi:hypothetical protein
MTGAVASDAVPVDGEEDPSLRPVTQELRLAVVLNGGVSLAVWISGVTHELNQLVQASRRRATRQGAGSDTYADLLKVLQADARIDVIAGTSAGGINGGFLALGLAHGCDLSGLRSSVRTGATSASCSGIHGRRTSRPSSAVTTSTSSWPRPMARSGTTGRENRRRPVRTSTCS